ncbi:hypothetical protein [Catellatospora sichuanensis]|uniref:hypothetical protein n=1 Tax=Catellatospora sichuanensis TaxID=1969805 RepID=UPI001182C017|nr:hypothetical protein [Catellatospora sichuanensis]
MNDVREAFGRLLEEPGPPPATAEQLLGAAHRARTRRRRTRGVTGAALAVLAVIGAAWLVPAEKTSPAPTTASPSSVPHLSDAAAQLVAQRMETTLGEILPAGVESVGGASSTWDGGVSSLPNGITTVGAFTDVLVGPRHGPLAGGQLLAYLLAGSETGAGDLCALTPGRGLLTGTEIGCEVLTVRGGKVRVGRMREAVAPARVASGYVEFHYAVRYVDGWLIMVWELPYTRQPLNNPVADGAVPMLDRPVFTPRRLAELTLEPGFAPPA